jgi:hypothetical protein
MGYELHITRKIDWSESDGPRIELSEWVTLIESDPELALDKSTQYLDWVSASFRGQEGALAWDNGQIHAKNPYNPLVNKMVAVAKRLNAEVQGDDGEVYNDDGSTFYHEPNVLKSPALGWIGRIRNWIRQRRTSRLLHRRAPSLRVGDRVKNLWGELGTVISLDRQANGGLGSVLVRLDEGREHNLAYVASGLQLISKSGGENLPIASQTETPWPAHHDPPPPPPNPPPTEPPPENPPPDQP